MSWEPLMSLGVIALSVVALGALVLLEAHERPPGDA